MRSADLVRDGLDRCPVPATDTARRRGGPARAGRIDRTRTLEILGRPCIEHVRKRGFIGVRLMDLTPDLRTHFGAPRDAGVMVSEIDKDSPAAKAGLAVGDIVTGADGERVASSGDLSRLVRRKKAGEALRLDVSRDRAAKHLSVAVEERDAPWIDIGDMGQLDHFRHLGPEIRAEVMRDLERNPPRIEMRRDRLEKKIDEMQKRIDELEKRLPKSAQ